jgi:hypothetical protein
MDLYWDNSGATAQTKEPRAHKRAKHMYYGVTISFTKSLVEVM